MAPETQPTGSLPCDACILVFQDHTPKIVGWCSLCKAWLCERCRGDWQIRFKAMAARAFQR